MNIVLLSGGSGNRLWPLSTPENSKQFLKILKTDDGRTESMLQRVFAQIHRVDPSAVVTVATSADQAAEIYRQLGETIRISIEPDKKDTFPAIALASAYLVDVLQIDPEETVAFCPVDPFADDSFFATIRDACAYISSVQEHLMLLGITPTAPLEKYGYIVPKTENDISLVASFKEKPDKKNAQRYIKNGALWNAGVFVFKLSYILKRAHELIDFSDYYDLFQKYHTLERISFDYAVVEHEKDILVKRYNGAWSDIGTWDALTATMDTHFVGKAVSDHPENVFVINETEKPIIVLGLENVVVSATDSGIIVSDIQASHKIKPYVDQAKKL